MKDFKIIYDPDPENPRDWENLGTMWCTHPRYNLGDQDADNPLDFEEIEDRWGNDWYGILDLLTPHPGITAKRCIAKIKNRIIEESMVVLPLYLYGHSGGTMSTNPFSCPWDSGQIGYIYVTRETALKELGHFDKEKIARILEGEVETYDKFLRGEVYGYVIFETDSEPEYDEEPEFDTPVYEESCWGYYDLKDCVKEAKNALL